MMDQLVYRSIIVNVNSFAELTEISKAMTQQTIDSYITFNRTESIVFTIVYSNQITEIQKRKTQKVIKLSFEDIKFPEYHQRISVDSISAVIETDSLSHAIRYTAVNRDSAAADGGIPEPRMYPLTYFIGFEKDDNYDHLLEKIPCNVILFDPCD